MRYNETFEDQLSPHQDTLLDLAWSDAESYLEPSPIDVARDQFEHKLKQLNPHNIASTHDYIFYLSHEVDERIHKGQPTPHKALFQLIGTKFGITEPTTRVVPAHDLSTAYQYGLHLLQSHEDIWMGTGSIDDHSDPGGKQNLNPPLYKHLRNKEDLLDALMLANDFEINHPGSFLKIFPQDREKPAIGSMVFSENKTEGKLLHLKVRKGEYTTSERKIGDDKPISISIDYSGNTLKVYTNQSTKETIYWLNIMINSQALFQKLDDIELNGSDYINPEFLVFLNGPDTKITFLTDCIWGSKIKSLQDHPCPKTHYFLDKLTSALENDSLLIIPEKQSQTLTSLDAYQFAVMRTLESGRSPEPESQTAAMLLKVQELSRKLKLPFHLPEMDAITAKSLWRISRGYPLDTTINIIEHYRNQLLINELPDPNIEYNNPRAKLDRFLKRVIHPQIFKVFKAILSPIKNRSTTRSKLNNWKQPYGGYISRKIALADAKAMYIANNKQ